MRNTTLLLMLFSLALAGCGQSRAFSTGSADITTDKQQTMFAGQAEIDVPDEVQLSYEGAVPEQVTIHGDVTIGLFAQRHSADSQHAIDAAVEAVNTLRELFGVEAEVEGLGLQ